MSRSKEQGSKEKAMQKATELLSVRPSENIPDGYFSSAEFAKQANLSIAHASHRLKQLYDAGQIFRIRVKNGFAYGFHEAPGAVKLQEITDASDRNNG